MKYSFMLCVNSIQEGNKNVFAPGNLNLTRREQDLQYELNLNEYKF